MKIFHARAVKIEGNSKEMVIEHKRKEVVDLYLLHCLFLLESTNLGPHIYSAMLDL